MYHGLVSNAKPITLGKGPLADAAAANLAPMFAALSDPIRLRLFDLVRRAGRDGICSCDLTEPLDRSQPTISHHLKVLREAGLVESRRDGTWIWYSIAPRALDAVSQFIQR
ncbi:MAG: metalloregulator ArsR/SmtB family transcription factor [Actinobacteria bacterium]|jgi:ArsR family transcriptional regulator|uniref:Unannotated protein n=1 Tax=freshwater metagenome TaxID=449393 RepID=A0A6J6M7K9_9ZZZZ|nr:metalloregulator ArsR/SmtB family transcription factor [Actinomycetota bacterium]MSZ60109.1 metalloregulator ArsR/SmtB family transcription factor [Actinomycetota bacterium]MSZ79981.1 metalloregulator ArsR/SmtB family transcription factor [Actinomycetota bacterium]MTB11768.1 metalloregulator ArsR/SmtB family transcription factor [Actinomycetota bacterium]